MNLYLTSSQIPEIAKLSKVQRQFVKKECLSWLYQRFPYRLGNMAITVGCVLLSAYWAAKLKWGVWRIGAAVSMVVLVLGYLYDMIWLAF